ncbi:MAG: M4 family metallopeptidase [Chitinophagales bacterium]|nr:M4 family metallopeptidase [Chitinophagales bacterium]
MKKLFIVCSCLLLMFPMVFAQQQIDLQNKKFVNHIDPASKPGWIEFRFEAPYIAEDLFTQQPELLGMKEDDEMRIFKTNTDVAGNKHYKFAQYYRGVRIEGVEHITHERNGKLYLANGDFISDLNLSVTPAISKERSIQIALNEIPAEEYLWEDVMEEAHFKEEKKDENATLYPAPELLIVKKDAKGEKAANNYVLAYRMYVFAKKPYAAKYVYVDAQTGEIIRTNDMDVNCSPTTYETTFNGEQTISTDYRTEDCGSGGDTETEYFSIDDCDPDSEIKSYYSGSYGTLSYGEDWLYCDSDNDWYIADGTKMVLTSLWAAKRAFAYFSAEFGHESYDGTDGLIDVFNNKTYFDDDDEPICYNANWQPVLDNIYFGSGVDCIAGTTDDFNTLDIIGHEYTHGIVYYAHIDPLYSFGQAAALNESFADIFGEMVEHWVEGSIDWIQGGDKTAGGVRVFGDPKSVDMPDTYLGDFWDDDGEEHQNSTVQSYMFYLLCVGGSGTNDHGVQYNVEGIGNEVAEEIGWQAMLNYLNNDDGYVTARNAWIQSAIDLYGSCSQEVISVGQAWQAVGVTEYTSFDNTSFCGTYSTTGYADATYGIENANLSFGDFTTNCTTTINSPAVVTLESGFYVQLNPGFEAKSGSTFIAWIDECEISDYDAGDLKYAETNSEDIITTNEIISAIHLYPVPADQSVSVSLELREQSNISISVMDISGREITNWMYDQFTEKGNNTLQFSTIDLMSGVYICVIKINGEMHTNKFIVQH